MNAPDRSAQVDVLAVMDGAAEVMGRDGYSAIPNDLIEARAAVAEFIKRAEYLCRTGEGMIAFRAALARIAPNELHDKAAELRGRGE